MAKPSGGEGAGPGMGMSSPVRQGSMSPRVRGRRIANRLYYVLVSAVCVACAFQVTRQVLLRPPRSREPVSCHQGLASLFSAVARAREAAAANTAGEDEALARFRSALSPEWGQRDEVAASCRASARDEGTLDAIERLRYAEEHAVRREAGELAPLRRRVQAIVDGELGPARPSVPGQR